ncbi:hypothetical protein BS47DRAFT_171220 [Hydnum rufescens UP504]|uniref:Uncharacterized protein n=1 Tax=Hydnum rufescens UP504 TaxID=1448309 RepID=A0A9P6B709_9AGAM|nr:hypothetical protein BS47DRAFT_171220 [Hydnum rufescens UP504]
MDPGLWVSGVRLSPPIRSSPILAPGPMLTIRIDLSIVLPLFWTCMQVDRKRCLLLTVTGWPNFLVFC